MGVEQLERKVIALEDRISKLEARLDKALGRVEDRDVIMQRQKDAVDVLLFLNLKAGKSYRLVETNLSFIEARLKSGASVQDCKAVIASKVAAWRNDPKMADYLRPSTLFNKEKFEAYLGMLPPIEMETEEDRPQKSGMPVIERVVTVCNRAG